MNRLVPALAMALFGSTAMAQTCTPVRLAQSENYNDLGGPKFALGIGGNSSDLPWHQVINGAVIYTNSTELWIGDNNEQGFVNVNDQFGGCLMSWGYEIVNWLQFSDSTTRTVIDRTNPSSFTEVVCGEVPSCAFNTDDPHNHLKIGPFAVHAGHTYVLSEFVYALIPEIPANTSVYSGTITIHVQ